MLARRERERPAAPRILGTEVRLEPVLVAAHANVRLPAGATGDAHRAAVDLLVAPLAAAFAPTWVLLSAGFDAHRADPLTDLGLSAGDFGDLTARLLALAPEGRRLVRDPLARQ